MTLRDSIETASTSVALAGGALGLVGTFTELFRGRKIRLAESAFRLVDELQKDPLAFAALQMLDWSGRTYKVGDLAYTIKFEDLDSALASHTEMATGFQPAQVFVRDAFDALFSRLDGIDHAVRIGMVREDDLEPGLQYWATSIMSHPAAVRFAQIYNYRCLELLQRLALAGKKQLGDHSQGLVNKQGLPPPGVAG